MMHPASLALVDKRKPNNEFVTPVKMADYWKSYGKHYCQTCKCWFADNKISIERHERSFSHKNKLQQHLRDSEREAREKKQQDAELQRILARMERGAAASMARDEANRRVNQARRGKK